MITSGLATPGKLDSFSTSGGVFPAELSTAPLRCACLGLRFAPLWIASETVSG
jgi:hypothetical protein